LPRTQTVPVIRASHVTLEERCSLTSQRLSWWPALRSREAAPCPAHRGGHHARLWLLTRRRSQPGRRTPR